MSERTKYNTKHRDRILRYLEGVQGKHITAADVCDHFRDQGDTIGQSTVYRQLERLVDEGVLNKYTIDINTPACFEYTGHETNTDGEVCFHCKCESCGRLIHLHCDEISGLKMHLEAEHSFMLDPRRTVFYGLCEDCARGSEQ
ncbi:MAG: transcriptional repressor [Lachnospiraceae bacterium]|nr:transcriptional repressor [Lachnospiraceae bacterium]